MRRLWLPCSSSRHLLGSSPCQGRTAEAPHADEETVAKLVETTQDAEALVAVGSGTINDICKYSAANTGKPYVVFGTAPSMNGYVSENAAITIHGHKKSLPARAPLAAFLDLGVMAAAPARMIRSGLGDSLCRSTAQAGRTSGRITCGSIPTA